MCGPTSSTTGGAPGAPRPHPPGYCRGELTLLPLPAAAGQLGWATLPGGHAAPPRHQGLIWLEGHTTCPSPLALAPSPPLWIHRLCSWPEVLQSRPCQRLGAAQPWAAMGAPPCNPHRYRHLRAQHRSRFQPLAEHAHHLFDQGPQRGKLTT